MLNADKINYRKNCWSYGNDCTFVRRTINGKPAKWWQVYCFVTNHPNGVTKKEILDAVWPGRNVPYRVVDSGYASNLFSQMHCKDVIFYDRDTHKWYSHGNYGSPDLALSRSIEAKRTKVNVPVIKVVTNEDGKKVATKIQYDYHIEEQPRTNFVVNNSTHTSETTPTDTSTKVCSNEDIKLAAMEYIYKLGASHYGKLDVKDVYNAFIAGASFAN